MKRKQIAMVGLGVAMAGVLIGSGCVLASALSHTEDVARTRDNKRAELGRIYSEPVFPSTAHVTMIHDDTRALSSWNTDFIKTQRAILQVETNLSPSQFKIQVLQPAIRELAKTQTDGGARVVAADFAFGFDAYIPGDRMPAVADIPRLAVQLELTRRLCREMFAANVIVLTKIQHAVSDRATPETPAHASRATRLGAVAPRPMADLDRNPPTLTGRHPFILEFTARKGAMLAVLNRLASCDLFVTVRDIDVRKAGSDVKAPPENWMEMGDAHHQQRVVSGPELDAPLLVRMTLDVEIF
ncbi:MAG: hypothetical protein FJ222_06445 [Lentisphaerae bacterium]|nr:hypothetical protein [Lentisphaerota bacterium]